MGDSYLCLFGVEFFRGSSRGLKGKTLLLYHTQHVLKFFNEGFENQNIGFYRVFNVII